VGTGAGLAWTPTVARAKATPAGYAALAGRCPVIKRAESLPAELSVDDAPEELGLPYWLLATADDPDAPAIVAFAARPLATPFSPSETARLEALMRLRRALAPRQPRVEVRSA
jgi:hypothetical protein